MLAVHPEAPIVPRNLPSNGRVVSNRASGYGLTQQQAPNHARGPRNVLTGSGYTEAFANTYNKGRIHPHQGTGYTNQQTRPNTTPATFAANHHQQRQHRSHEYGVLYHNRCRDLNLVARQSNGCRMLPHRPSGYNSSAQQQQRGPITSVDLLNAAAQRLPPPPSPPASVNNTPQHALPVNPAPVTFSMNVTGHTQHSSPAIVASPQSAPHRQPSTSASLNTAMTTPAALHDQLELATSVAASVASLQQELQRLQREKTRLERDVQERKSNPNTGDDHPPSPSYSFTFEADDEELEPPSSIAPVDDDVPTDFLCPITGEIMKDPVVTADGYTYEREAIAKWLESHHTSPLTNLALECTFMAPNLALRNQIQEHVAVSLGRQN